MNQNPLHHIVRIRSSDDLTYIRPGLMDEVVVNANQLENSVLATSASLWRTTLPFSVDPVLWRFQIPAWSRNGKGDTKRNYIRLGLAYGRETGLSLGEKPLIDTVNADDQWRTLARNVVEYQRDRLGAVPTQLELLADLRPLEPSRLIAPALVALSADEDRINRVLADASAEAAGQPVAVQVIIPFERLLVEQEVTRLLSTIPRDGVSSYLVWTPKVTEERLLADNDLLGALFRLVGQLADRGIAVGHQYANYTIFAMHDVGLAAATHHLGWVDHGEPAEEQGFRLRSCQSYLPGVRHAVRFPDAWKMGGPLAKEEYEKWYCECTFCIGLYAEGTHPLELLLESRTVTMKNGRVQETPTSQAVGANTWHYLLSRRLEVQAFSADSVASVIGRDIERAAALKRSGDVSRLEHLATELKAS